MAIGAPDPRTTRPPPSDATGGASAPFGELVSRTHDSVVIRHRLHPQSAAWLAHHSIGREVSTRDPQLHALSVVPLAMSLELMAEAARVLAPGRTVGRLFNVRARRWLDFDNEERTIVIRARLDRERQVVEADARLLSDAEGDAPAAVEASIEVTERYPSGAPPSVAAALTPSAVEPERYYETALYHDATWQVLRSRAYVDERRASAQLELGPGSGFAGHDIETLCLHPLLMDGVGQLLGLWSAQMLSEGLFHFPVGAQQVTLYGPPPAGPQGALIVLDVTAVEPELLVADAEVSVGGLLYARVTGFQSRRFYVPRHLQPLAIPTAIGNVGRPVALDDLGLAGTRSVAVTLDLGELRDERFVSRVWAARILTRAERQRHRPQHNEAGYSLGWLAGLHAAKEAARRLLAERLALDVRLADVEIANVDGRYRAAPSAAGSPHGNAVEWPDVHVWIAQSGDRAAALASLESSPGDAGPALERLVATPSAETTARPNPDEVLQRLRATIERLSGDWEINQPITPETRLVADLAMKSIDLVVIASAMVNAYGLIPFDELYAQMAGIPAAERDLTIAQLIQFVCDRTPAEAVAVHAQG